MVSVPPEARPAPDGPVLDLTGAEPGPAARGWTARLEIAVPAGLLVIIFGACFLLPFVMPMPKPVGGNIIEANQPLFSPGHLLGTDPVGNDVFSRLLHGGRVSLEIAVVVNLIGLTMGGLLGAFAAYRGGAMDSVIMRMLDALIAFPSLVLAMAIAQSLGPSKGNTILALCFFSVPAFARTARAETLRLRELTFITAARLSGARTGRVLFRHITPNILPQLITFGLLGMGIIIVVEGALSFLRLGIPPPNPSWGNMIYQGQQVISGAPMLVLLPSAVLFLSTLSFNLLGDAMRARWNVT
jgi:peptide/nickel transport system permease protein